MTLSERSRKRFLRLARAEEILLRVGDAVLHDPGDERGIEIARDHRLGVVRLRDRPGIALVACGVENPNSSFNSRCVGTSVISST